MKEPGFFIIGMMIVFFLGCNVQKQDAKLDLFEAIVKGDQAQVKTLLKKGADANARDEAGWTPLMEALASEKVDLTLLKP